MDKIIQVLGKQHVEWFLKQPDYIRKRYELAAWGANLLPQAAAYHKLNRMIERRRKRGCSV